MVLPKGAQDLAIVSYPIQPLVIGDLITACPATDHVWVLARFVIYDVVIPTPAEVFLRVHLAHDVIGPPPSVVLVFAEPVVGFAVSNKVGSSSSKDEIGAAVE